MSNLDVWYARLDVDGRAAPDAPADARQEGEARLDKSVEKAHAKDSLQASAQLTDVVDGERRIRQRPAAAGADRRARSADERGTSSRTGIRELARPLPRARLSDDRRQPARRLPVRRRRPQGRRGRQRRHPRLDRPDARPRRRATRSSCRSRRRRPRCSSRTPRRASSSNHGAAGGRGPAADAGRQRHLPRLAAGRPGSTASERDFYVRQLRDWKGSVDVETMSRRTLLEVYGQLCGWTLARAHARSGDRIAIAAYLGTGDAFDRAIAEFAERLRRPERARPRGAGRGRNAGRITAHTISERYAAWQRPAPGPDSC